MKVAKVAGVALLSGALVLVAACSRGGDARGAAELEAVAVTVAPVELREFTRGQWLPGTVHPADAAEVASKIMANVAETHVVIGQEVREGDLLIQLRALEIGAQVEQARGGLAQIERNLQRERQLLQQDATSEEAVRTLEDQLRIARARLLEAETMESYTRILAPFDGIVTRENVRRGDLARPGAALLTVEGLGARQVHLHVPDSLATLELGTVVRVEANGQTWEGRLSEWSPAADPSTRTRLAKLDMAEADLRSGQFVRVNWPDHPAQGLFIPEAAVRRIGQVEQVFVWDAGTLRLRLVRTGPRRDGYVQILAGLSAEEPVVKAVGGNLRLRDGQPATL